MSEDQNEVGGTLRWRLEKVEEAVTELKSAIKDLTTAIQAVGQTASNAGGRAAATLAVVVALLAGSVGGYALIRSDQANNQADQANATAIANCNSQETTKGIMNTILLQFRADAAPEIRPTFDAALRLTQPRDCPTN